ncbi:hypothetical protein PCE1_002095 [Barthelona sp. PCE]
MFAISIPGLPLNTEYTDLSDTSFEFLINDVVNPKYGTVFLIDHEDVSHDVVCAVYLETPFTDGEYSLVGYIGASNPTLLMRIDGGPDKDEMFNIRVGLEICDKESVREAIQEQHENLIEENTELNDLLDGIGSKIVSNLQDYLESYAVDVEDITVIPLASLDEWVDNFNRKIRLNPRFWEDFE